MTKNPSGWYVSQTWSDATTHAIATSQRWCLPCWSYDQIQQSTMYHASMKHVWPKFVHQNLWLQVKWTIHRVNPNVNKSSLLAFPLETWFQDATQKLQHSVSQWPWTAGAVSYQQYQYTMINHQIQSDVCIVLNSRRTCHGHVADCAPPQELCTSKPQNKVSHCNAMTRKIKSVLPW